MRRAPADRRRWGASGFRSPSASRTSAGTACTWRRPILEQFLDAELARHKLPPSALALVGFSQGTMMSLHVGLAPRGAARRDRRLFRHAGARRRYGRRGLRPQVRARPPVLLIHGDPDDLIPMQALFHCCQGAGRAGRAGRMAHLRRHRPRNRRRRPAPRRRIPRAALPGRAADQIQYDGVTAFPCFTIPSRCL